MVVWNTDGGLDKILSGLNLKAFKKDWSTDFQKSMDRCTGHCDITEIFFEMALNHIPCYLEISKSFGPCQPA